MFPEPNGPIIVKFFVRKVGFGVQTLEAVGNPLYDHSEDAMKLLNLCS